jgi:TPP-dependent pyruvate/acetoin dehydrogenase alpha subunit
VVADGLLDAVYLDAIDEEIRADFKAYVADAKQAAWPSISELTKNVYISY